jgi:opacity protein-like surface antigen
MKLKQLAVIILLFSSPILYSQNFMISVGAGLSVPMSESSFTDAYNLGFNVHGSMTFPLSNNISARGDLQYNNFPWDENSPNIGGSFKVTTIKADIIVGGQTPSNLSPYGLVGAGLYLLSSSVTQNNVTISSSTTEFGMGLGGGVNFGVSSKASIYVEAQYNFIFSDGGAKGYLPVKAGVMFRL